MRRSNALWEVFVLRFEEAMDRYRIFTRYRQRDRQPAAPSTWSAIASASARHTSG